MQEHDLTKTEIRRSSARIFELLLDWFPDIIQSVDSNGNIVYANRRASELLGYSPEELLRLGIQRLYAPEVLANMKTGFSELKQEGQLRVESVVQNKAGEKIPVEIRSFAVYDDDGTFLRSFSILRDVRDIKELQNGLIHAGRLAAIGELAACVAHDISNPLAVIKLYIELMSMQMDTLAGAGADAAAMTSLKDAVTSVQKSADRIEKLVNHLRGFCRNTEGDVAPVDLLRVVDDALFMVTNKIQKNDINVVHDVQDDGSWSVRGHSNQLEQVFMNLASNACDALKGRPQPTLTVAFRRLPADGKPPMIEATVSDNGCGMTPEVQNQAFASFFTTKPKGEGTGLGLTIARNIVRRHGGDIAVRSEVGTGTTFAVTLPVFQASGAPVQQEGPGNAAC